MLSRERRLTVLRALLLSSAMVACDARDATELRPPAAPAVVAQSDSSERSESSFISGDTVVRSSGARAHAWLQNANLVAELVAAPGDTFLVVRGSDCTDCDGGAMILLRSLTVGPIDMMRMPPAFTVPGRVVSMDDSAEVESDTRLFWGTCMSDRRPGLLQLQYPTEPRGSESLTVIFAEASSGAVSISDWRWPGDTLAARERLPQSGCNEIPSVHRRADP